MGKYDKMTQEEFDKLLEELVYEDGASVLLSIPGVYECVSEYYNNKVLERWENNQGDENGDT